MLYTAITLKIIGFFCIVVAFVISTMVIPCINKRIKKINEDINDFKDARHLFSFTKLDAGKTYLERKIEYLTWDFMNTLNQSKEKLDEIMNSALNNTIQMAEVYTSLLSYSEKGKLLKKLKEDIQAIFKMDIPLFKKLERSNILFKESQRLAGERLREKHVEWKKNERKLSQLESKTSIWNSWFFASQILGLTLLSLSEVLLQFNTQSE